MSHSQADCVTNEVGNVIEFQSVDADRNVSTILPTNMLKWSSPPCQHPCLHFVKATRYGAHQRHKTQM